MKDAQKTNAEAQAEIAIELAKSWCKDFPASCIADDDEGLHALQTERNRVEQDLNDMHDDDGDFKLDLIQTHSPTTNRAGASQSDRCPDHHPFIRPGNSPVCLHTYAAA